MSPHSSRKMFAKKRKYGLAAQGPYSGPPILMAGGFSSGAGSCRAVVALTFRSARDGTTEMPTPPCGVGATIPWPRRQNRGAVEKPQGCTASLALHLCLFARIWFASSWLCCRRGTNRPDAPGRYHRPISVHHPEFTIRLSPFTLHNSLRPCEYSLPTAGCCPHSSGRHPARAERRKGSDANHESNSSERAGR